MLYKTFFIIGDSPHCITYYIMQGLSTWFYYTVNPRLRDDLEGATPGPMNDRTQPEPAAHRQTVTDYQGEEKRNVIIVRGRLTECGMNQVGTNSFQRSSTVFPANTAPSAHHQSYSTLSHAQYSYRQLL